MQDSRRITLSFKIDGELSYIEGDGRRLYLEPNPPIITGCTTARLAEEISPYHIKENDASSRSYLIT